LKRIFIALQYNTAVNVLVFDTN